MLNINEIESLHRFKGSFKKRWKFPRSAVLFLEPAGSVLDKKNIFLAPTGAQEITQCVCLT